MILDSGKTCSFLCFPSGAFESVVILDSGKTSTGQRELVQTFESIVILDSGKTWAESFRTKDEV